MLNFIWVSFFIAAFISATVQTFTGNADIWNALTQSLFTSAKDAFTISLSLTGMLCFWMGLLKIAELSGVTDLLARGLKPLFQKIFPNIPAESKAFGNIIMNMAANFLGLDNAATPAGLNAMQELQKYNSNKSVASDAQILFLVINTSAVTLIPISILMYRAQMGSAYPTAVFLPILLATTASTLAGFLAVAFVQRLDIFNKTVGGYFALLLAIVGGSAAYFLRLPADVRTVAATNISGFILYGFVTLFIVAAIYKKINAYEAFIDGAKDGFSIAVKIIPYLVAMLTAIAVFRSSGLMNAVLSIFEKGVSALGMNTDFVHALPTAFMKPLSGSGSRAMMIETMQNYGADSFPAFASGVIQGSTETTFYVLAVYFGAVQISKTRHALPCALIADAAGIITAILVSYWFY